MLAQDFLKVEQNNLDIKLLKLQNDHILTQFIESKTILGEDFNLSDPEQLKIINSKILVCTDDPLPGDQSKIRVNNYNSEFIKVNPKIRFFVSDNSITEINFKDTLEVSRIIVLNNSSRKDIVNIEVIFKSKRVKKRTEKVIRNKFRFIYNLTTEAISCRRMNE